LLCRRAALTPQYVNFSALQGTVRIFASAFLRTLDTLAELFEGNEALFKGFEAYKRWDWARRFPVIRLSFGEGQPIHLIGVEFSRERRGVVGFEVETIAGSRRLA
jgi:hypothetical protein